VDISIVIISHNHAPYLTPCLNSLYKYAEGFSFEVILIDNNSEDNTVELIKRDFPQVLLVENKKRYSFAKNNNIGIKKAKGRYILLLNPDTTFSDNALLKVMNFMDEHKEVGVSACKLLNPDGSVQDSCRRFPNPLAIFVRGFGLERYFGECKFYKRYLMADFDHEEIREIDWALGAFLFVRREVIDEVGLLDEKYPLYHEDTDWCFRIKKKGWKIYYLPFISITHHYLRTSAKSFISKRKMLHFISICRFFYKHSFRMLKDSLF
jgi:hypothetical protein